MNKNPHIHSMDDNRGLREVFLDGERVSRAVYADTEKGVVRRFKVDPKTGDVEWDRENKCGVEEELRGKVTVEFL